jgi:hypothetical protein
MNEEESTMKTMTLQTTIDPNGTIHLDIPSDLPPGPAEVKLTIQPISLDMPTAAAGREARSQTCSGLFFGKLQEDYDIDAALDEMNSQWKAELQDLGREP